MRRYIYLRYIYIRVRGTCIYTDELKKRNIEILRYFNNAWVNFDVLICSIIFIEGHAILSYTFYGNVIVDV